MLVSGGGTALPYLDAVPRLSTTTIVLPGAMIIGDVQTDDDVSIWYNAVVRGDVHAITIGEASNVQDLAMLHVTHDTHPLLIGRRVTVGHNVCLHGCTINDEALIGIGSTVLDGALVESHAIVAAGALVPPGMRVPRGTVVAGVPARALRTVRDAEISEILANAERYRQLAKAQRLP